MIHSNKVALLTLFAVSVNQTSLINTVLFIMFLVLSMANNVSTLTYWKITMAFTSGFMTLQYIFRVVLQPNEDEKLNRGSSWCVTGLIICDEDIDATNGEVYNSL